MKYFCAILSLSVSLILLNACQEEDLTSTLRSDPDLFINQPTSPLKITEPQSFNGFTQANEYVSYFYPRFPRPLPCPVLAGCQLPRPELVVTVAKGYIKKVSAQLYTEDRKLYASSDEGTVTDGNQEAQLAFEVINDQMKAHKLMMTLEMVYQVDGKTYSERFVDENVPLSLDMYKKAGRLLYRLPRPPRPLPCPVLAGCQDPKPQLHVIVPGGNVLKMDAQLYTEDQELYACSGKACEGELERSEQEALATMTVVNPKIDTKSLILVLRITYEVDGKIFSDEIYDEDVPIAMD